MSTKQTITTAALQAEIDKQNLRISDLEKVLNMEKGLSKYYYDLLQKETDINKTLKADLETSQAQLHTANIAHTTDLNTINELYERHVNDVNTIQAKNAEIEDLNTELRFQRLRLLLADPETHSDSETEEENDDQME